MLAFVQMGSTAEEKAALVGGVIARADTTGLTGVLYRADASASNTALTLPVDSNGKAVIRGKWLALYAKSTDVQYAFGAGSAPTLTYNQNVTIGTGHAAAGGTCPAGLVAQFLVPLTATHISLIAETATGKVELYVLEALSGGK